MKNPWFNIPALDYEGHMNSPNVNQLSFLGRIFKDSLSKYDTESIALLGCATGNGLEFINVNKTNYIAAVDLNNEYLTILSGRFSEKLPMLEIIEADLNYYKFRNNRFSFIFAGLIFEYLDCYILLNKIYRWLNFNGVLTVVIQIENKNKCKISETEYSSLKQLNSIMKLIEPEDFKKFAEKSGFIEIESRIHILKSGKSFLTASYRKI